MMLYQYLFNHSLDHADAAFPSFPHPSIITGFVTRVTRRVPLVDHLLLTLSEYLSSRPVLSRVRAT